MYASLSLFISAQGISVRRRRMQSVSHCRALKGFGMFPEFYITIFLLPGILFTLLQSAAWVMSGLTAKKRQRNRKCNLALFKTLWLKHARLPAFSSWMDFFQGLSRTGRQWGVGESWWFCPPFLTWTGYRCPSRRLIASSWRGCFREVR